MVLFTGRVKKMVKTLTLTLRVKKTLHNTLIYNDKTYYDADIHCAKALFTRNVFVCATVNITVNFNTVYMMTETGM